MPDELELVMDDSGNEVILGSGCFGQVYKGRYLGTEVAIKVFPMDQFPESADPKEIKLLRKCRSEYVVQFKGVTQVGNARWLIMEYMAGGTLTKALASSSAFLWRHGGKTVALDVAKGMAFLHANGIIHMDLKTPNILLSAEGRAQNLRCGLSKTMGSRTHASKVGFGTYNWTAPEVLMYERATYKADVFSFGVILWEIVTGRLPKRGDGCSVEVPKECCAETDALIKACLASDFRQRPTAMEVVRELERITRPEGPPSPFLKEAEPRQAPESVALTSSSHLKAVIQREAASAVAHLKKNLPNRRMSTPVGGALVAPNGALDETPRAPTSLFHKSISPEVNLRKRSAGPYMRSDTL
eukprot:jgi/Botrbrau1/12101/Bobra.0186s0022.1